MKTRHLLPVLLALAGCGKPQEKKMPPAAIEGGAALSAPAPAPLDPALAALAELTFVPEDAEALVRVNLADVAARSPDPTQSLKAFDFILRAQQPAAWQVLSGAGITVGKELSTLYLVIGPAGSGDPYLIAGSGTFDAVRLAEGLRKTGAVVEGAGEGASLFRWKRGATAGAALPPESQGELGEAAVGVARGIVLFGGPALVRRALAGRAGGGRDIRHGPLAPELLAVDRGATVWGAAGKLASMPGLERGHFQASLAAPGRDLDALFLLRASFGSKAQAEAFGDKLRGLLDAAAIFGERTPIGATLGQMRKNAKLSVEGTTLVASASLD